MSVARSQIRAGLRDTNDGLMRRQFLFREAIVEVSVEVQGRHSRVVGAVQPLPGSKIFGVVADFAREFRFERSHAGFEGCELGRVVFNVY